MSAEQHPVSMHLPGLPPVVTPEAAPYWRAAADGRLDLQRCRGCEAVIWYPRALCPECGQGEPTWFTATGRGVIYSYTINRRPVGQFAEAGPYVLAYVELDEGPRILTNIVTTNLAAVRVGQRVQAIFQPIASNVALVRFAPVDGGVPLA
jgi:uncharacterized OB-fold protein